MVISATTSGDGMTDKSKNPCIPKPLCDVAFGVWMNPWVG